MFETKKTSTSKRISSVQQVSEIFEVSEVSVRRWAIAGCPCRTKNHRRFFDPIEIQTWLRENRKTCQPGRPAKEIDPQLADLEYRKQTALCEKFERENKVARGELINRADEESRDVKAIVALRNKLCGMPAALAARLAGMDQAEIQVTIDGRIEQIIDEYEKTMLPMPKPEPEPVGATT